MAAIFFDGSNIREQSFEKGHTRNNLVKLFQILTSGYGGEDFLRISSCPYTAKSLPPKRQPCFSTDQNFKHIFEKGHTRKNLVKLFQNWTRGFREEDFLRISSCLYSAKSLPHPHGGHVFQQIKISRTTFKRVTQGTFL